MGVCVVWAGFLEEPLEVVCKRPRLMLVTLHGGQDMPHTGVARLPVTAVVMVGHHRGPLRALLAPLFAALDALLSVMDSDIGWRLLTATWGHLPTSLGLTKHDSLIAGGVLDGDATWLLECVPKIVTMLVLEQVPCVALTQAVCQGSPGEPGGWSRA
jgi:hypothetical protein